MCGWGRVSLLRAAMFLATQGLGIVPRRASSLGPLAQDEGTSKNFAASRLRGEDLYRSAALLSSRLAHLVLRPGPVMSHLANSPLWVAKGSM